MAQEAADCLFYKAEISWCLEDEICISYLILLVGIINEFNEENNCSFLLEGFIEMVKEELSLDVEE